MTADQDAAAAVLAAAVSHSAGIWVGQDGAQVALQAAQVGQPEPDPGASNVTSPGANNVTSPGANSHTGRGTNNPGDAA